MKILVLGGNGYLGKKTVQMLRADGADVVCTVRNVNEREAYDVDGAKAISSSTADILDAMRDAKYDYVINTICRYGRAGTGYDEITESNLVYPLQVLDALTGNGVTDFMTIGTGLKDDTNLYSFSKSKFSEFGRFYSHDRNINFTVLKPEMFYGYDEPGGRFLPDMIRKMKKGEPVETTIGTQHRDIIRIEDVVKAISIVIRSDLKGYNEIPVGTGEAPSISEIVDYIWEQTGRRSVVNKGAVPMRRNEPDSVADISVISRLAEWKPVSWQDGLLEMINKTEVDGI